MAKRERSSAFDQARRSQAIQDMLNEAEQEAAQAGPQTSGQGKPGHAGKPGTDKRGVSKATYNLPLDTQALVRTMAAEYDIPMNDVVEAAIVLLHNAQAQNADLLPALRVPARLLTARFRLSVPADFYFFSEASQP